MLMYSKEDQVVQRHELAAVPVPPATRSYKPLPFADFADIVQDAFESKGLYFGDQQYVLARNDTQLFALAEIRNYSNDAERAVVAFRSSTNKSLAPSLVGGASVSVCTNLDLFGGEYKAGHKQTTFILSELRNRIDVFVNQYGQATEQRALQVARYKEAQMDAKLASTAIVQMYRQGIVTTQRIGKIIDEYDNPTHPEHLNAQGQRTNWTLFNAATEAMKGTALDTLPQRTAKLHDLIGKASDYVLGGTPTRHAA